MAEEVLCIFQQAQCFENEDKEILDRSGVAIGSGMSATSDLAKAGQIIHAGNTRKYAFKAQ